MLSVRLTPEMEQKLEQLAGDEKMSKSGIIKEALQQYFDNKERTETGYQRAKERQLKLMESGLDFGLSGKTKWSRDELHER